MNALYTLNENIAVIETVGVFIINADYLTWLQRRSSYFISDGHGSDQSEVQQIIDMRVQVRWMHYETDLPLTENCGMEATSKVMNSDIVIDLAVLRESLETAKRSSSSY